MEFLNILGAVGTVAGLYDFVSDKLRNDRKQFVRKIKDTVADVCREVTNDLERSAELRDALPDSAVGIITDSVLKALEENRPFTKGDVLPGEELGDNLRHALWAGLIRGCTSRLNTPCAITPRG